MERVDTGRLSARGRGWWTAVLLCLPAAAPLGAQAPQIAPGGIVSAADHSDAALGLAPGSLFTIYGRNLGGDARVTLRAGDAELECAVLYQSFSQINAVAPPGAPPGSAAIRVHTQAGQSEPVPVPIVPARFTAFTTGGGAFGPAIAQQHDGSGLRLNRLLDPAGILQTVVLWGAGLGGGERTDVSVSFGLIDSRPFYAGPAPGLPGVDQINVLLPAGILLDCFLPFTVEAGGVRSAVYALATGTPGQPCSSRFALGREGLQALDEGGTVRIAAMTVENETAEAWFGEYDAPRLSRLSQYDLQPYATPLACERRAYGYDRLSVPPARLLPPELYGLRRADDASPTFAVTGPGGCAWDLARGPDGVHRAGAPAGCPPLAWSIRGGTAAAAGSTSFDIPLPPIPEASFDRASGAVEWRENFAGRLTLEIASRHTLPGNIFNGQTTVRELTCRLSGNSGAARLNGADLAWVYGLPSGEPAVFRQWSGGITGGGWTGPSAALHVRLLRVRSRRAE